MAAWAGGHGLRFGISNGWRGLWKKRPAQLDRICEVDAEEVLGEDHAETLMSLLPPVGWAEGATKHDLVVLELRIDARFDAQDATFESRFDAQDATFGSRIDQLRAEFQRDLRQQLVTFLTANAVLLGLFTALG